MVNPKISSIWRGIKALQSGPVGGINVSDTPSIFGERARAAARRLCFLARHIANSNQCLKPLPSDPHTRLRQEIYIRALETLPNLTVHYGHYLQSKKSMPLATARPGGPRFADVLNMEEKGSDVNIATYMLVDAFRKDCDQLIVITNDSDLAEPVRIINKELMIPVGIFNPHTHDTEVRRARVTGKPPRPARPSIELKKVAKFHRNITSEEPTCHMALSQFAPVLTDAQGRTITKPAGW